MVETSILDYPGVAKIATLTAELAEIATLTAELGETRDRLLTTIQEKLGSIFKAFLADTELSRLQWTQYCPYFNGGTFNRYSVKYFNTLVVLAGEDVNDIDPDEAKVNICNMDRADPLYAKITAMNTFMDSIHKSLWKSLFGDHVQVIVTSDGIDVKEYDHD